MNTLYKVDNINFRQLQEQIELPSFQRSLVWTDSKKKNFINTVISGAPFGSLLLYKEMDKFLLVDGLQRYSTLKDFILYPNNYINLYDDCIKTITNIIKFMQSNINVVTNFKTLEKEIFSLIKDHFSLEKDVGEMANSIIGKLPVVLETDNSTLLHIQMLINQMLLGIKNKYNIYELYIPVIIYHGEYNKLPDIFENVNSTGTTLNRYDIYAAKWSRINFHIEDANFLSVVEKKYDDIIKETGIDILNYYSGQICQSKEINLFEFCFALGKQLKQTCTNILGTKIGNNSDVDSIGFVLLSAILTNSVQKIDTLPKYFENADSSELIKFKNKVIECAKEVDNLLCKFVLSLDGKPVIKYIEYQMVCIISTLFKIKYVETSDRPLLFKERANNKDLLQSFKKNMPKRYLYDIVGDYWSGSGDSKVADEIQMLLSRIRSNRYVTPIIKESWYVILNEWTENQMQRPSKKVSSETKIFLNYITNLTILKAKYQDKKFNFEYIVSKDRFNKKFQNENGLSALGNICYLPQFEVKSKQEKTIYEQIDNKSMVYDVNEEILNDFLYPTRSELSFVKTDESFTYENYLKFLKDRNNYLINKFVDLIGE